MSTVEKLNNFFINGFVADVALPPYIQAAKQAAVSEFGRVLMPTKKTESYRFTQFGAEILEVIGSGGLSSYSNVGKDVDMNAVFGSDAEAGGIDGALNVFVVGDLLQVGRLGNGSEGMERVGNSGITVCDFDRAYSEFGDVLSDEFGRALGDSRDPFALINTGYFRRGLYISIPDYTVCESPVVVHHYIPHDTDQICYPRILIRVGRSSKVDLVHRFIGEAGDGGNSVCYTNLVAEVMVDRSARVGHYVVQEGLLNKSMTNSFNFLLDRNCVVDSFNLNFSGSKVRNNLNITVNGSNSYANMYGLCIAGDGMHVDNHTEVRHMVADSYSNQLYKGVMLGDSRVVFDGKIYVEQDAQRINAFQANNTVMLSEDAQLYSKPQLEIYADDVKCSHGATVGQLDDEQVFYMRARGIPRDEARAMLLKAFLYDIVGKVSSKSINGYISGIVENKVVNSLD